MGTEEIHHYTGISKEELNAFKNYYEDMLKNNRKKSDFQEKEIGDLNNKIKGLKENMKKYEEDLQAKNIEVLNGKYNFEEVREKYYETFDLLKECQNDRDNALKNLGEMTKKLKEAEDFADQFKKNWEEMKKKYEDEKKTSSELEIKNKLKDKIITSLKNKREELKKLNKQLEQHNQFLEKANKQLRSNLDVLTKNYDNMVQRFDDMEQHYNEIKDQNEETLNKLNDNENTMKDIKKQNEEQKNKIQKLTKQNEDILKNQNTLALQMGELLKAFGNLNLKSKNDKNDSIN